MHTLIVTMSSKKSKRQTQHELDDQHFEMEALKAEIRELKAERTPAMNSVPLPRQNPYDGSTSFVAWRNQFKSLSASSRWGEEEKRLRLMSSLQAEASEYIFNLPDFADLSLMN